MTFQFGTNWNVLSKMSGPIQGLLLVIRDVYGLRLGTELFWRSHFRSVTRAAMVLSVLDRDGGVGDDDLRVLD
jgi:cytochrome bd-type quinol oxidase subunit 1